MITLPVNLSEKIDNVNLPLSLAVAMGLVGGVTYDRKFGRNSAVGTTLSPITTGGFYRTPTTAPVLEILSSATGDKSDGAGARTVLIVGLSETGAYQEETVTMNGTTAVTLTKSFIRVFRLRILTSGTYANQTTPSQLGTITLREESGGDIWHTIPELVSGFGAGQSLIGAFTVPLGKVAYVFVDRVSVDSNKSADLFFFERDNILNISAPYDPLRIRKARVGINAPFSTEFAFPQVYDELTDFGFMAKVDTRTADVSVEYEILEVDK